MNVTAIITPIKEEFTPKSEQLGLFPTALQNSPPNLQNSPPNLQNSKFPNPRYTWTDAPNWWNPHGEEIAYIENPLTKQKLYGIKVAEHIPTGWGAVLDYGGRIIPTKDLKFIS